MRKLSRWTTAALVATLGAVPGTPAAAQEYPSVSRPEEVRLAMSAGPLTVSRDADVYVMGARGFERAHRGTNGFACLVVRSAAQRHVLAPHCLNPDAVEGVLPALLREGELQARGWSAERIDQELRRGWDSGELPLPEGPAYAFMLSDGQRLGPNGGSFMPHMMLYVPYATNASVGGDPSNMQFPFVGPFENHPLSTVVFVMKEFVSPASVELPSR